MMDTEFEKWWKALTNLDVNNIRLYFELCFRAGREAQTDDICMYLDTYGYTDTGAIRTRFPARPKAPKWRADEED